jgi:hypothetical protein
MKKKMNTRTALMLLSAALSVTTVDTQAQNLKGKKTNPNIDSRSQESTYAHEKLKSFEAYVIKAKEIGATHVDITFDIPPAFWQFDTPGDPYPVWYTYRPGLMKIFPPEELKPYVDVEYAEKVAALFQARCEILRRHGMKGAYSANEPYVLPETFFTDHPELRGARVDHPHRSRVARFAPCVDEPDVLAMYRESMRLLLARCPEIEIFSFLTSDSGSGFCWAPALYSGQNGNANCRNRPMTERVVGFLEGLRNAAREAGKHIEVNIHPIVPRQWMIETFDRPELLSARLSDGLTIGNYKNADGQQFDSGISGWGKESFSPVLGLPNPVLRAQQLVRMVQEDKPAGSRLLVSYEDPSTADFNVELYRLFVQTKPHTSTEAMQVLREFAKTLAGKEGADDLLDIWLALYEISNDLLVLDFGPVLTFGPVMERWINRPLVPVPENLTDEERSYYRPFIFQAKGEEQANDLIDIQAMRMFEGYGARLLVQRVYEMIVQKLEKAERLTNKLFRQGKDAEAANRWEALGNRLAVLHSLVRTIDNVVGYQALLDVAHTRGISPEPNPVLGTGPSWDRQEIMRIARNEIDNTANLKRILESSRVPLIQEALLPKYETIRMLGPDLTSQLKKKIDIMNAHWEDYKQLYTSPNY